MHYFKCIIEAFISLEAGMKALRGERGSDAARVEGKLAHYQVAANIGENACQVCVSLDVFCFQESTTDPIRTR